MVNIKLTPELVLANLELFLKLIPEDTISKINNNNKETEDKVQQLWKETYDKNFKLVSEVLAGLNTPEEEPVVVPEEEPDNTLTIPEDIKETIIRKIGAEQPPSYCNYTISEFKSKDGKTNNQPYFVYYQDGKGKESAPLKPGTNNFNNLCLYAELVDMFELTGYQNYINISVFNELLTSLGIENIDSDNSVVKFYFKNNPQVKETGFFNSEKIEAIINWGSPSISN